MGLAHSVGVDEADRPLTILDPRAAELIAVAKNGGADPTAMLSVESVFGSSLPANPMFVRKVGDALRMLSNHGVRATLKHYIANSAST